MPEPRVASLAEPVKLVVWDLDETYWSGTLTEGGIEARPEHVEMVRELNRRGIVNAICSKNDLYQARAQLVELGTWEDFVFPTVSWAPKGPQIAGLIHAMQLRAPNVLFVDDNPMNLEEARHYAPGIQTLHPDLLAALLDAPQMAGKDDAALTRVAQYRLLETKAADRQEQTGSNEDFLRSSGITVTLGEDCDAHKDRVLELVNRTNQLNYTKRRLSEDELDELLADPSAEARYVKVQDDYGDYGICGFYALADGALTDFVFSCRILHMGVENWLYERLGRPALEVSGDIATPLEPAAHIDWITERSNHDAPARPQSTAPSLGRILLKGGCDLSMLADFLDGDFRQEVTFVGTSGAQVHQDHSETLRRAAAGIDDYSDVIDRLPFLDRTAYETEVLGSPTPYHAVVYSVLMDYTQGLYRYRGSELVVPYGQYDQDITDPRAWDALIAKYGAVGFTRPFLEWFAENFAFEGGITSSRLRGNVEWLRSAIPAETELIVLNGSELDIEHATEAGRYLRHREFNAALSEAIEPLDNVRICDVRTVVTSREDVTDNIRHYTRRAYLGLARQLAELLGTGVATQTGAKRLRRLVVQRGRRLARRLVR